MILTDNLYNPACTSNRAKMGSLSPVMSTGVILLEAVMPTSHSQGAAGNTGGGAGWNSHICLLSTTYVESSINNPYYQLFAEHLHFQIPYVASKRANLFSTSSSTNSSTVERFSRVTSSKTPQVGSPRSFLS